MPFETRFDDVYRLGIKAAVDELGMLATRVDEQVFHKEDILARIYNQIEAADFIIADMSAEIRMSFTKSDMPMRSRSFVSCSPATLLIFHLILSIIRHIVYGQSISALKQKLTIDLAAVKVELEARKCALRIDDGSVHLDVARIFGNLTTTESLRDGYRRHLFRYAQ